MDHFIDRWPTSPDLVLKPMRIKLEWLAAGTAVGLAAHAVATNVRKKNAITGLIKEGKEVSKNRRDLDE